MPTSINQPTTPTAQRQPLRVDTTTTAPVSVVQVTQQENRTSSTSSPSGSNDEISPSNNSSGSIGSTRRDRLANFTVEEDELLCSCWLTVMQDPIVGCDQTRVDFWDRIHALYVKNNQLPINRSADGLKYRHKLILHAVIKFAGNYDSILRLNESGKNDDDRLNDAKRLYYQDHKKHFKFEGCWRIKADFDLWKVAQDAAAAAART